ncbi:hypothetical protein H4582DRAFT_1938731 [Lactarius indigo]|nr:hypothetical protein H4582DRAFT_1938731 [Lactarius indigo]
MSRLPPALLYLTIYNPLLKPSGPVSDDDEDAEEQAHILFYTSRERAVSRDKMLRQVGLAKALISFSDLFVSEDTCDNVHSHSRRMLMVSPEPGFWIHACVELAKTPRPPPVNKGKSKDKGKSGSKAADKGRNGESSVVYDYHDASVHDLALRAQVLRGYEEFKLTHGSFTSVLKTLGQQALELQLERFFTVWAWKWDIEEDSEFGNCLGVPLHPLHKSIGPALDDFVLDNPLLKGCAPFVLSHPHMIPSTSYATNPPSPVLPFYIRSRLRIIPPPAPVSSSEPSPTSPKQGTDIFVSSMNATRGAMGATGQAFVAIGASMDVRKWTWPGYLTFSKGTLQKTGPRDQPADAENGSEKQQVEPVEDEAAGEPLPPNTEARIQVEVDRESLHEAMSSDGISEPHEEETVGEESASVVEPTPQATEATTAGADATMQGASQPLQDEDEQVSSPPTSPSTPVVHPPDFVSPPSPSSSQGTLPVPLPAPSFRSFALHFAHEDPLATVQRRVLYVTKDQLTLAFLEPIITMSEGDSTTLYQASSALLANVQGLIDHDEASGAETPLTAAKILQPKDKYVIVTSEGTTVTSAEFSSRSEHLFNGSQLIANGDATEVFSRTQGPQHWHVARREAESMVYLEVLRKETSLADVENELVGTVRRFRESR